MRLHRVLAFSLLTLSAHSVFAQDAVLMRRVFTNDLVEQFKVTTHMDTTFKSDDEEFKSSLDLTNDRFFKFTEVEKERNPKFAF